MTERTGTLRTWHEDRGFGFIAPTDGGRELFVHISAFARDGSRPVVGERLAFDIAAGKDGKPQATKVRRLALGASASRPDPELLAKVGPKTSPKKHLSRAPKKTPRKKRGVLAVLIFCGIAFALASFGYTSFQAASKRRALQQLPADAEIESPRAPVVSAYQCDGRTHCSQMTSCAEATFFLNNCPGTKMDGNNDGTPCEQQWCTSPFAN